MNENRRDKVFLPPPVDAYKGEEPYIFVSYSHQDKNRVYPEILRLYNLGYRIWYDEGIEPTKKIPDEVAEAIENSRLFLVFISKNSIRSQYVYNEINYAFENHIEFLAIYLEKTALPRGLKLLTGSLNAIEKFDMLERIYIVKMEKVLPIELLKDQRDGKIEEVEEMKNELTMDTKEPFIPSAGKIKKVYKYHAFITFKDTDEEGDPTHDSILARKIFKFLSGKGLNVFHNTTSVENLGEAESEKAIEDALDSSQIMVVVGISPENVNSGKVHHMWNRFNNLIVGGVKPDGLIVSYIKGFDRSELSEVLGNNEVIIDSDVSRERLFKLILNLIDMGKEASLKDLDIKMLFEMGKKILLSRVFGDGPDEITISPGEVLTVGRKNDNDIILNLRQVSRRHAEIIFNKEGLSVKDLNSWNGTFVNKEKIDYKELKLGDVVKFDAISYKVCLPSDEKSEESL
jgi:hypothetical protein